MVKLIRLVVLVSALVANVAPVLADPFNPCGPLPNCNPGPTTNPC